MGTQADSERLQLLADLGLATGAFAQMIAGVRPEQLTAPTPCAGVDVRTLIEHLTEGSRYFADLLRDPGSRPPLTNTGSLPDAFQAAAGLMLSEFAAPGCLARDFDSPVGRSSGARLAKVRLIELVVHGWDLARATGQSADAFPGDICERTLAIAEELYADRGAGFDQPQPVSQTAPAADRLAAFLGRRVTGTLSR